MSSSVPTPRQFLTSLIESLDSIPTSTAPQPSAAGAGNPLKLIPAAHRPLLTTLYALYPLTLLPALDLLDRRLATRIIIAPYTRQEDTVTSGPSSSSPLVDHEEKGQQEQPQDRRQHTFFIVRSAQPQRPRRDASASGTGSISAPGPRYVVRLNAWNCSCAAFAFAAFPRGEDREIGPYAINPPASSSSSRAKEETDDDGLDWQFGALSFDGTQGSGIAGVPCCKHLLACVLAEKWSAVLGGYVDERIVGREEAAGLVADV
ncbi:hypothetical protein Daesc_003349 [Daldinia eschscholtzii]|uniref:SWIM-type domain-containing protein n=1 Tax=Daldinia eschscholtzii TaxID=292717 RepID=A0AAX6MT64_9PEZI